MACQDATAHPIWYNVDHAIMHLQVGDRERERQYVFCLTVHVHVKFTSFVSCVPSWLHQINKRELWPPEPVNRVGAQVDCV